MKRVFVLSIFLLLGSILLLGKTDEASGSIKALRDSLELTILDIRKIESNQETMTFKIDAVDKLLEHSTSAISNELSASNKVLTVSALIISLVAILLGLFVTWMQDKVKKMSETVKSLSDNVEEKKQEVEKLAKEINTNFDSLFKRIRRADTLEYLKRLEAVPKDIVNLSEILLARELEPEDFPYLKNAYFKLVESGDENSGTNFFGDNYGKSYRLQLFQHFCGESIADDFIRDRMVADFDRLVACCFENDIKKSLSEVAPILSKKDVTFDRLVVLKALLSALNKSSFSKNTDIFEILKDGIGDEELWIAAHNA